LSKLNPIQAEDARRLIERGEAVLIDIRERDEHAREHIAEAHLAPLSGFDPAAAPASARVAVFHCKSGMRTQSNAARLVACGYAEAYYLAGGIEAWKRAGYPVRTR
jgi:rhodanese-related sulfurtransferase